MSSLLSRVRSPLAQVSLRNRLVVGVLVLSALGFAASDFAARSALRSYLVNQVDTQLSGIAGGSVLRLDRAGIQAEADDANDPSHEAKPLRPFGRVPTAISVTLLNQSGTIIGAVGGDLATQQIADYLTGFTPHFVEQKNSRPFTITTSGSDFRVLARVLPSSVGSVVVAQSLENVDQVTQKLQFFFIFIGLIALLIIGLASRKVIDLGLKPLVAVEETAEAIAAGDLSARMPIAKPNTEVGNLVSSLNQMLTRIEEAFTARTTSENRLRRFVADASHELRTPLTAIRGFAELHRQGAVQGESATSELLGRIEKESIRMSSLVEDLLLLARMDQSPDIAQLPVDLNHLLIEVAESARAAGPAHPIEISIPETRLIVTGDSGRLHQVVANLLANARVHTPAGTKIHVSAQRVEDGITIDVADNGPGLSQEAQGRIFERFYRADPSRQRTGQEGSGLGLAIVESVMHAHHGRVSVRSELGKGATFTLFFPNNSGGEKI